MTETRELIGTGKAVAARLRPLFASERVVVSVLLLAAVVTRFYDLGSESFWLDEATTFIRSHLPLKELVADAEHAYHNPTYFVLIHYWMKLGDSEGMLRMPSAIFGVLEVPVVYLLGRIVAGRFTAFGAAIALLLNPKVVHYSQEARMYALYCLSASVAMTALVWLVAHPAEAARRPWRKPGSVGETSSATTAARRAWIAFVVGAIVSLYCHATAVLFVVACSVVALLFLAVRPLERRGFLVNWVIANLTILLVFAPWIPSLFGQTEAMAEKGFWMGDQSSDTVHSLLRSVFLFGNRSVWLAALVVLFALLGTFALRKQPLVLATLWLLTVLGPALLLLASLRQPMFMPRLFLWSVTPFAVIVGAGMVVARPLVVKLACLTVFVVLGTYWLNRGYYAPRTKPEWYDAIKLVSDRLKSGERVIAIARRERRLLQYYFERSSNPIPSFPYTEVTGSSDEKVDTLVGDARAVWTIQGRHWDTAEKVRSKLMLRGRRGVVRHFGGDVSVERYSMRQDRKPGE